MLKKLTDPNDEDEDENDYDLEDMQLTLEAVKIVLGDDSELATWIKSDIQEYETEDVD